MRVAVAIVCSALFLMGCEDNRASKDRIDAKSPNAVLTWAKKHWSYLKNVEYRSGILEITPNPRPASDDLFMIGDFAFNFLKAYKSAAANPDAIKTLRLTWTAELVDQYKNSVGRQEIIALRYDVAEALKYNFDRASLYDVMNAAQLQILHPVARNAAEKYCTEKVKKWSHRFCARYL